MTVQSIVNYVKKKYRVTFSISGMTDLLHRMNFVYKNPKIFPRKVDVIEQEQFIEEYAEIKENKVIYIICDNAGCYRSRIVKAHLEFSKIKLVFLPPYSLNFILIDIGIF